MVSLGGTWYGRTTFVWFYSIIVIDEDSAGIFDWQFRMGKFITSGGYKDCPGRTIIQYMPDEEPTGSLDKCIRQESLNMAEDYLWKTIWEGTVRRSVEDEN